MCHAGRRHILCHLAAAPTKPTRVRATVGKCLRMPAMHAMQGAACVTMLGPANASAAAPNQGA